jgi:hypothetical protein
MLCKIIAEERILKEYLQYRCRTFLRTKRTKQKIFNEHDESSRVDLQPAWHLLFLIARTFGVKETMLLEESGQVERLESHSQHHVWPDFVSVALEVVECVVSNGPENEKMQSLLPLTQRTVLEKSSKDPVCCAPCVPTPRSFLRPWKPPKILVQISCRFVRVEFQDKSSPTSWTLGLCRYVKIYVLCSSNSVSEKSRIEFLGWYSYLNLL